MSTKDSSSNSANVNKAFVGSTLVVTGGTGTFGSAVLARFLNAGLREIRIFSRDEKKQDDMRRQYSHPALRFYLGDVREPRSLVDVMNGADYVFHAAALKQVPSCEFHPMEAVRTNVIGADNVLNAAVAAGVKRVVMLSTDKAAYPISAMGISKALMEKVTIAKSRVAEQSGTTLCTTRYGNVMASRGSVIPLFIAQIRAGHPLTVTDPQMTRFMMTVEDAVELVIFAFIHGNAGDLLVQKAPAATLAVLAEAIKRIFKAQNPVRVIGTRHGEKLYETLLTREEMVRSEDLGGYFRVKPDARDLNYASYFTEGQPELSASPDYHSHNATQLDVDEMMELLHKLEVVREALRPEAL